MTLTITLLSVIILSVVFHLLLCLEKLGAYYALNNLSIYLNGKQKNSMGKTLFSDYLNLQFKMLKLKDR